MNLRCCIVWCFIAVVLISQIKAATCISTGNGNWALGTTWSCGSIPTCGDSVVIQAGHTVTITSQQDLRSCGSLFKLAVYGVLRFTSGNKLRLACNSRVYVLSGGSLVPGGGGGSSNELEICGATMWQASDGTYSGPGCFPSTLTTCGAVLPVELVFFKQVNCGKSGVCLSWETASERNNSFFVVERSFDALDFTAIKTVKSKSPDGNSKGPLQYEFMDNELFSDYTYYRLKQTDSDLSYVYSDIISVNSNEKNNDLFNVSVHPNPGNGNFYVTYSGANQDAKVEFVLKGVGGRELLRKTVRAGSLNEFILGSNFESGFYICQISSGEYFRQIKLVVNSH